MSAALTTKNKVGLVIAFLLGLSDIGGAFAPTPDGQDGPPRAVLVVGGLLGVATIVAVFIGWRMADRAAIRIAAGTRIISAILSLPAFFVDVPAGLKALAAVGVVITIVSVVLMLTPPRTANVVTD
jgi:hypothetical protein